MMDIPEDAVEAALWALDPVDGPDGASPEMRKGVIVALTAAYPLLARAAIDVAVAERLAEAWDEGWRVGASGRNQRNPYREVGKS